MLIFYKFLKTKKIFSEILNNNCRLYLHVSENCKNQKLKSIKDFELTLIKQHSNEHIFVECLLCADGASPLSKIL